MTDTSTEHEPYTAEWLAAMQAEPLHPALQDYVEEGNWGMMLRHPLVYQIPMMLPGAANEAYAMKRARLAEAVEQQDWHTVVFLHERAYRLRALIDYVLGRDLDGFIYPLSTRVEHADLVTSVWVDSENIEQHLDDWQAVFRNGACPWLGEEAGKRAFDMLPDPVVAYRGGNVGDWSWTTNPDTAAFFANRWGAGRKVRQALIPKADVFGYILDRGESELMVRLTDERREMVYPHG